MSGGTAHRVVAQVDVEAVLGEAPARSDRLLGLALGLDPGPLQAVMQLSGAVGVVAIHARGLTAAVAVIAWPVLGVGVLGVGVEQVGDQVLRGAGAPALPAVTVVAVMISESGSMPTCAL